MSRNVSAPRHESISGTATPASARRWQPSTGTRRVIREVLVVALAALLYFIVRGLMDSRASVAFANADALIALEQRLGLYHEPAMQGWITGSAWLTDLANRVYIFGHWPVIIATMLWLVFRHPAAFARYRSALLLSGAIGLVFFVLLPMAPPRFLVDYGFVDTVTQHSNAYRVLQPPSLTNPYAAMPSLHVGWNLLMGIALVRHSTVRGVRLFGWVMPLIMWLATVVTANHYLLDGVAGSVVALTGLALAIWIERRRNQAQQRAIVSAPSRSIGQGWTHRPAA